MDADERGSIRAHLRPSAAKYIKVFGFCASNERGLAKVVHEHRRR
jgi:hypothetical protein